MLYLNQLNYGHIPYHHNVANGGVPAERRNVGTSGCGLCCLCMVVDQLTSRTLEIEEAVRMSEQFGANVDLGTRLDILGPIIADMYGLEYSASENLDEVKHCLRNGGCVIYLAEGDLEDGHIGVFTHRGHYLLMISVDEDDDFCMLDPALKEGKYDEEGRQGKVQVKTPFIYCKPDVILEEAVTYREPYYLFRRRK